MTPNCSISNRSKIDERKRNYNVYSDVQRIYSYRNHVHSINIKNDEIQWEKKHAFSDTQINYIL